MKIIICHLLLCASVFANGEIKQVPFTDVQVTDAGQIRNSIDYLDEVKISQSNQNSLTLQPKKAKRER